ncbi:replicative DNA helicase [Nitrosovibrio sp. Nv6]|uniref:replicative DNA helicase n=1 Tax=Nitrosovibrio sp. Nv6 TaxID=1855340 RepID=UPI0008B88FE7|nr:replicative DNA helicase [Nitrosovibrio sp. Nv6]SEO78533.1 replicative DNA helicase [Nitrosovibrio sp. Nv6]
MAHMDAEFGRKVSGEEVSVEAEQSLIGALLRDNSAYDRISDFPGNSFIREDHRVIFRSIQTRLDAGKPADIILIAEALEAHGELERVGGLPYLGTLVESVSTSANIKHYAKLIENAAILRRLKVSAEEISLSCDSHENPRDIAEAAEQKILSVLDTQNSARDYVHIKEAVAEAVEWEDSDHAGLSTGLRDLDRLIGGMVAPDLVLIAGRPSMGKTALAIQIAESVSKTDPAAVFSLEMSRRQIASRMLKYHSATTNLSEAVRHLYGLNMQIDDTPAVSIGHIRSRCRRIKRQHGLSLIVIDYLQLMKGQGDNRTQEIGSISRGLKSIAKEFGVPVIALSQLSREVEKRGDKRPVMSDLRDSGEIEQDADLILFVYRDEVYDDMSEARGTAEIICRKNRNGAIGDCRLTFQGEFTRFGNYDGARIERSVARVERGFKVGM